MGRSVAQAHPPASPLVETAARIDHDLTPAIVRCPRSEGIPPYPPWPKLQATEKVSGYVMDRPSIKPKCGKQRSYHIDRLVENKEVSKWISQPTGSPLSRNECFEQIQNSGNFSKSNMGGRKFTKSEQKAVSKFQGLCRPTAVRRARLRCCRPRQTFE